MKLLASRAGVGIDWWLPWAPDTNAVTVAVRDDSTDDEFECSSNRS
jgi:hypothetical protein